MPNSLPHSSFTRPWPQSCAAFRAQAHPAICRTPAKNLSPGTIQTGPGRSLGPAQALEGGSGCRSPGTEFPSRARTHCDPTAVCFLFDTAFLWKPAFRRPRRSLAHTFLPDSKKSALIDKIRAAGGVSRRTPFRHSRPPGKPALPGRNWPSLYEPFTAQLHPS